MKQPDEPTSADETTAPTLSDDSAASQDMSTPMPAGMITTNPGAMSTTNPGAAGMITTNPGAKTNVPGMMTTQLAQSLAERDQVIVVHPDEVVGLQQRHQAPRQQAIHALIGLVLIFAIAKAAQEIVAHRPERRIGIAIVVAIEIASLQIGRDERDVVANEDFGFARLVVDELAAPAEPDASRLSQCRQQADRESARRSATARNGHAIRHAHESRHNASSHGRLRRMAEVMIPTRL